MGINYLDIAPSQYRDADLRSLRTVMASVISGTARKTILFLGDSTNMAKGAGTGATGEIGARVNSPSNVAARRLNALGIPARADAFFGNADALTGTAADYTSYNPNVTFGTGWSDGLHGLRYPGGAYWQNSTTTNALTFTPERAADRFDIYYLAAAGSGNGTFTVTDGATTLATINTNLGTFNVYKQTVSRASATTSPISIQRNGTGTTVSIAAIDPWNSTLPELCILNASRSGAMASDITTTGNVAYMSNVITVIDADYHIIEYGLNESNNGVSLATFKSTLQSLVTSALALGGVAIGISQPADGSSYDLASDWRAAIKALALSNGVPCIDHYARFVSRAVDTSVYFDAVHCNALGYAIKGGNLARFLLSAAP